MSGIRHALDRGLDRRDETVDLAHEHAEIVGAGEIEALFQVAAEQQVFQIVVGFFQVVAPSRGKEDQEEQAPEHPQSGKHLKRGGRQHGGGEYRQTQQQREDSEQHRLQTDPGKQGEGRGMGGNGPAMKNPDRGVALFQALVDGFGRLDFFPTGTGAHRLVADDLAVLADRRSIGNDPVETAILAPVLDHAAPRPPLLEVLPHVGKGLRRHVGMADQVVRLADHLFAPETADPGEGFIGLDDVSLEVGSRVDELTFRKMRFRIGDRLVVTHCCFPMFFGSCWRFWRVSAQ